MIDPLRNERPLCPLLPLPLSLLARVSSCNFEAEGRGEGSALCCLILCVIGVILACAACSGALVAMSTPLGVLVDHEETDMELSTPERAASGLPFYIPTPSPQHSSSQEVPTDFGSVGATKRAALWVEGGEDRKHP